MAVGHDAASCAMIARLKFSVKVARHIGLWKTKIKYGVDGDASSLSAFFESINCVQVRTAAFGAAHPPAKSAERVGQPSSRS